MDMKADVRIKRFVDAAMYVLFVLLMGQCVLRGAVHEWLGIAIGILFVIHNALNYRWYKALFKGKYNALRSVQAAVNFLLIILMLICMASGILVSQHIFAVKDGNAIEFGRRLHLMATAWAFILMTVHLGLHWSIFASVGKKLSNEKARRYIKLFCRTVTIVLCAYGLYQFVDRRFWEEMFHLIDYQKEYDYSKSVPAYFAGTAALSALFVAATYYAKKLLLSAVKKAGHPR